LILIELVGETLARPASEHELNQQATPGYRNYLVYCDESGIDGQVYHGFGSLWMPWKWRDPFLEVLDSLREKHKYTDELKWTMVNRRSLPFFRDLLEEFFTRKWLMFHCVIIRKGYVDLDFHEDFDEARRKHFAMLIKAKIKFFTGRAKNKAYHVRVDPLPSRYEKADEAAMKIVEATLKNELGLSPLQSLTTIDSKTSPGIQVTDLFLGAVMADWQKRATSDHKLQLRQELAQYLGWNDLKADTHLSECKFNIWYFFDPTSHKEREIKTRAVNLKIPMPPLVSPY
jgi:hypothetical protein